MAVATTTEPRFQSIGMRQTYSITHTYAQNCKAHKMRDVFIVSNRNRKKLIISLHVLVVYYVCTKHISQASSIIHKKSIYKNVVVKNNFSTK